jgi:phenylalanyl-tRNA synthetase beta chain
MKILLSWLREHLGGGYTTRDVILTLNKTGFQCERIQFCEEAWNRVCVAKITNKLQHPNADRLNIYTVLSCGKTYDIVCGDQTLQIGDFIPFALPGSVLPNGIALSAAKIRGVNSPGMLCSANELNLPIIQPGVLHCYESDYDKTIGQAYENEAIIDIDVTTNRGDGLSIRGIARHLADYNCGQLLPLEKKTICDSGVQLFQITSDDCSGFACGVVEYSVKTTPSNIAKRLQLLGQNVVDIDAVDIANYVMHEIGHPMHIFDADKVHGKLRVENLKSHCAFETLFGTSVNLKTGTLVISDEEKIISWPGVVGGNNSKATNGTKKILIESGMFAIDSIQCREAKIATHAMKIFEYGANIENVQIVLERFLYLLGGGIIQFSSEITSVKKTISFNIDLVEKILGYSINEEQILSTLISRGFTVSQKNNKEFAVDVPPHKHRKIQTPNCVIEELVDYDNLKNVHLDLCPPINDNRDYVDSLTDLAVFSGFYETHNFSITKDNNYFYQIPILNPGNENYSHLRSDIFEQQLAIAKWHQDNKYEYSNFFEIGSIYYNNYFYKNKKEHDRFMQYNVFSAISKNYEVLLDLFYKFLAIHNFKVPKTSHSFDYVVNHNMNLSNGVIFIAHPIDNDSSFRDLYFAECGAIEDDFLLKHNLPQYYVLEIFLDRLHLLDKIKYLPQAKQAPIYRDISINLPANVSYSVLTDLLNEYNCWIFDVYPSKEQGIDKKIGLRFMLCENEILTNDQINKKINAIEKRISECIKEFQE